MGSEHSLMGWKPCQACQGRGIVPDVPGEALRRIRQDRGRTLREVAEALGFTQPYLSDVEHGRRRATERIVEAYLALEVAP